jgi:hypothetical protein
MQVFKVSEVSKVASYSLNETEKKLTVEGVVIDLETAARDCQTIINITKNCDGKCVASLDGKCGYVADIEIPPREYRTEEFGEGDEKTYEIMPLPLDTATVVLRLWPFGAEEDIGVEE